MSASNIKFIDVSFSYDSSIEPVFSSLNIHFSKGWTGIVGPNGAGKSTLAKLAAGLLKPTTGTIAVDESLILHYCEQNTSDFPSDSESFMSSDGAFSGRIRSFLGIEESWPERWDTLSHGERKCFQIGVALWKEPDVLVLDEPLNHVDLHTRSLILTALSDFQGIGIIVSHERDVLDSLCHECVFVRSGEIIQRRGNFSEGFFQQQLEDSARERLYEEAVYKYSDARKRAVLLKQNEKGKERKLSKRNIPKHDHDAKSKVDGARLTGKDKKGARKAIVFEKRADKMGEEASSLYFRQRKVEGIIFHGQKSRSSRIVSIEARMIQLGPNKSLYVPALEIFPSDRIAIKGRNGSGKSTFLELIIPMIDLIPDKILYIPQEIDGELWEKVNHCLRDLNSKDVGAVFTAVHRLGSEPERLIGSSLPSPGEKRKIMLAMGLLKEPSIIILDEPTNHMDLPSIRCLESALNLYEGALLIVSHDITFIKNTVAKEWEIVQNRDIMELRA